MGGRSVVVVGLAPSSLLRVFTLCMRVVSILVVAAASETLFVGTLGTVAWPMALGGCTTPRGDV
eukprot:2020957-Amphidinium_carterae.1